MEVTEAAVLVRRIAAEALIAQCRRDGLDDVQIREWCEMQYNERDRQFEREMLAVGIVVSMQAVKVDALRRLTH